MVYPLHIKEEIVTAAALTLESNTKTTTKSGKLSMPNTSQVAVSHFKKAQYRRIYRNLKETETKVTTRK